MNILNEEIQSWIEFAEALRSDDRQLFLDMLKSCNEFRESFNAKGEEFSTDSLLMSLIYLQHRMIKTLLTDAAASHLIIA